MFVTDTDRGEEIVSEADRSISATTRSRVSLTVRKAKYAKESQLSRATDQLIRISPDWKNKGVDIHGISRLSDGSGIRVDVSDPAKAALLRPTLGGTLDGDVATTDVTFAQGSKAVDVSGRGNDTTTPYAAGTRIRTEDPSSDPDWCTSGFGMRTSSGGTAMVSAAHCFEIGDRMRSGALTVTMGTVNQRTTIYDAAAAPTNTYEVVFYEGSNWTRYGSWNYSYNGQSVCQSGYPSDRICALEVIDDDYVFQSDDGSWRRSVRTSRGPGGITVRGGDSGGPVYVTQSNGLKQSRGIVSAGDYCEFARDRFDRPNFTCSNMMFTETGRILDQLNGSLLVQ